MRNENGVLTLLPRLFPGLVAELNDCSISRHLAAEPYAAGHLNGVPFRRVQFGDGRRLDGAD